MKERIKKIRRELGLTQQEFAERIGIKRNTIANYETGRNDPVDSVISLICREFDVREEWLRTGEGEMFKPKSYDMLDQLADKYNLSTTDRAVIEKFLSMNPEARKEMLDYFYNFVAILTHETEPPQPMDHIMETIKNQQKENAAPEMSVEQAEADYIKKISETVQKRESTALNTTDGTGKARANNT